MAPAMAGLFRRFRRSRGEPVEPEPVLEPDETSAEPVADDSYVTLDGAEVPDEPAYEPTAAPEAEATVEGPGSPDPAVAAAPEPAVEVAPELGPPPSVTPPEPDRPLEAPAPSAPAAPPAVAVPAGRAPPVGPSSGPFVPPLPAPGAASTHDALSMPSTANCFLCGHRLEANGFCPSCQMTWVE